MTKDLNVSSDLTIREQMAIRLIILLIKLVKPFEWSHELDKALEPITKLLDKKNDRTSL